MCCTRNTDIKVYSTRSENDIVAEQMRSLRCEDAMLSSIRYRNRRRKGKEIDDEKENSVRLSISSVRIQKNM